MTFTRRKFIKALTIAGASLASQLDSRPGYALLPPSTVPLGKHMRVIPSTGEKIPAIGLGSWLTFSINLDDNEALASRVALLRKFLAHGGGMLDSSPMYGVAQDVIGIALSRIADHKGLYSATKVWTTGNRQGLIQMEASRQRWGTSRFDLMQVHNLLDWETHLPGLFAMKEQGDIRYVGVTTSHGRRHDRLIRIMQTQPLDFVQFTYNMLDREAEQTLLPLARERGIAVIINRPFRRGYLFDKFERYPLPAWAGEIDCQNWAQFFLKFIISHPAVTCTIPATSKLAHLRENMAAGYGVLPEEKMRQQMLAYVNNL